MSDTKAERLADALNDFLRASPDVEAAAVVSFDGLSMASALPEDVDEDRMGAMAAALLSLGEQAAAGLGRGDLRQIFVEGDEGFVFLMAARNEAVLAAVTGRQAKIGLMLYEMRHAADIVGAVLAERVADDLNEFKVRFDDVPVYTNGATPIPAASSAPEASAPWAS
jgi:uncharacterized protein